MSQDLRLGTIVLVVIVLVFAIIGTLMYETDNNVKVYLDVYGLTSQSGSVPVAHMRLVVINGGPLPFSASYSVFLVYAHLPTLTKNFTVSLSPGQTAEFDFEVPALSSLQSVYVSGHGIYNYNLKGDYPSAVSNITNLSMKLANKTVVPQPKGFFVQQSIPPNPLSYSFRINLVNQTIYTNGTVVYYVNVTFFPLSNGGIKAALYSIINVELNGNYKAFTVIPGRSFTLIVSTSSFPIKLIFNVTTSNGSLLGYGVYNVTA